MTCDATVTAYAGRDIRCNLPCGHDGDHGLIPAFAQLTTERIATCPECMGDCIDEGFDFWCMACQASWTFAQVGYFEDDDRDD